MMRKLAIEAELQAAAERCWQARNFLVAEAKAAGSDELHFAARYAEHVTEAISSFKRKIGEYVAPAAEVAS